MFRYYILYFFCIGILNSIQSQTIDQSKLESSLDSLIQKTMEEEHIPGAAFIIVKDGKTLLKKGYGYTSLGEDVRRVDPDSTIFRIGSVTKTFTATALLQLVDQKKVDLYMDVNQYLKSVKVPNTYKTPVTLANLLDHSAGFDELRGRVVYRENQSIPLADYLKNRIVRVREPGVISSYSSFGIALAGLLVEDISGQKLDAYMKKHIWEPLGMHMTSMFLNDQVEQYASWGYEYRNGVNLPQPWEFYHTYPASEINSTVADMGKYLLMHLNNGILDDQRVLSTSLSQKMKSAELRVHDTVEAFAYGFYEEDAHGFRTISHGGDMLGYASYMAMIPEEKLGVFVIHHHEGTRLRYAVMDIILKTFAKEKEQQIVGSKPVKGKTDFNKLAGHYIWTTHCHSCESGWKPNREELVVNSDGTFTIMNRTYEEIDHLVFRSKDGMRTMGFIENEKGEIQYMSLGGVNTFEKVD
ncbi:serine hydrolase domain-containing protein [Aquimarina litoralis]|uniref:serine hydrolase domain-containing protein n=1 Tax=Aquimarina litoralis TaxID=584605 RepID=UPI001C598B13|nr:serine hydrolase domain-containing protein [Aquimarina litoralis]MBW1297414.1 serine hydrolase [Aquimarina litoralis]